MFPPTHNPRRDPICVAAVDIGGTKIGIALASADGVTLGHTRLETRANEGAASALRRIALAIDELQAALPNRPELVALAAVCPGVIQPERILLAPNLPGWEQTALARELRDATGIRSVAVTNDVRAGALAEARFGALRGSRSGIYLSLGTGLAAALVLDGVVAEGAHHAAGEIAYSRTSGLLSGVSALSSRDLEIAAGGKALAERASSVLGTQITAEQLFTRTDPVAVHLVHQALGAIGTALINLAVFVNPDRVVIGGGLTTSAQLIVPVLQAYVNTGVPFPPEIVLGEFNQGASLRGAVALALESVGDDAMRAKPDLNSAASR